MSSRFNERCQKIKRSSKSSQTPTKSFKQVKTTLHNIPSGTQRLIPRSNPRPPSNRLRTPAPRLPTAREQRRSKGLSPPHFPTHPAPSLTSFSLGIFGPSPILQHLQAGRPRPPQTRAQRSRHGRRRPPRIHRSGNQAVGETNSGDTDREREQEDGTVSVADADAKPAIDLTSTEIQNLRR